MDIKSIWDSVVGTSTDKGPVTTTVETKSNTGMIIGGVVVLILVVAVVVFFIKKEG